MTQLLISIAQEIGAPRSFGPMVALANISRLDAEGRGLGTRVQSDVIIPISDSSAVAEVDLDPGRYVISASLPTGSLLVEHVEVSGLAPMRIALREPEILLEIVTSRKSIAPDGNSKTLRRPRLQPNQNAVGQLGDRDIVSRFASKSSSVHLQPKVEGTSRLSVRKRRLSSKQIIEPANFQEVEGRPFPTSRRRLFDLSLQGTDLWRSPLVQGFSFVNADEWARELWFASAAYSADELKSNSPRDELSHTAKLVRSHEQGEYPDFGSDVNDGNPEGIRGQRYVCAADDDGRLRQLAVVPMHWRGGTSWLQDDQALAEVTDAWDANSGRWNLRVDIADGRFASLLGYLTQGDLVNARHLIKDSLEILMAKVENPYAAAAGGYILIYSKDEDIGHRDWPAWIQNLARWFPSLPDGQVLLATLYLQRSRLATRIGGGALTRVERLQKARYLLERAMRAGLPLYSLGTRLLVENLEILVHEERALQYERSSRDMPLVAALETAREMAARMRTVQPMTVIDLRSDASNFGSTAQGKLTPLR